MPEVVRTPVGYKTIETGGGLQLMVGPSDFRGPGFGYNVPPPPGGVESYIVARDIGGVEFSAFRLSPAGPGAAQWSYTLPSGAPAGRYGIRLTLEYSDGDPAPSFAGLLAIGLADPADDLTALPLALATDVQVQSVALPPPRMSVLEWEFSNPTPKPFVACVLTKPDNPPFAGIIYLYQATLSFLGE